MSFDESLEEEDEEISNCDHSEYESDNSKNSGMGCKSLSTVPNEILCGVESYNSDGLNHGSSKNNIKLCNCDDSGCDCDAEDRYNEYKCKHQMENPELYKLKFKLENPQLFPKIHRHLQSHSKLSTYLFPNLIYKRILSSFISDESCTDNSHDENIHAYHSNNNHEEGLIDHYNNIGKITDDVSIDSNERNNLAKNY